MKPGTIVRLPDGREGTVTYHGLDGYGIRWGRIQVDEELLRSLCPLFEEPNVPEEARGYAPQAMLRDPFDGAELPCVGDDYEVVEMAMKEN